MGKQEDKQSQNNQELPKKKIIKKVLNKVSAQEKDQLKDWKPTKITKPLPRAQSKKQEKTNIASQFLSSLSKPQNQTLKAKKPKFDFDIDEPIIKAPKPKIQMKPTAQQIKWDIEDQSFIRKDFLPPKEVTQKIVEGEDEQEQIIDERGKTQKIRKIDLSKIVDDNWKQEAQRRQITRQLYSGADGLIDEKSKMAKIVKQAQNNAYKIEDSLNRRDFEKQQIRNRYGW